MCATRSRYVVNFSSCIRYRTRVVSLRKRIPQIHLLCMWLMLMRDAVCCLSSVCRIHVCQMQRRDNFFFLRSAFRNVYKCEMFLCFYISPLSLKRVHVVLSTYININYAQTSSSASEAWSNDFYHWFSSCCGEWGRERAANDQICFVF